MQYDSNGDEVTLNFSLPSGCFATSVIRELIEEIPVERHYPQD
jgi:tRNA pseudouridine13 synthase